MARFGLAAVGVFGIALVGMLARAVPMPPAWVWSVEMIFVVVLGVNITAWLVVPRVIGSVVASNRPVPAGRSSSDRDRDPDWSSTTEWQSETWSSSWDYAGGDSPDAGDGPDDDWSVGRPGAEQADRRARGKDGSGPRGSGPSGSGRTYGFGGSSW